jgi:hypothetical protein
MGAGPAAEEEEDEELEEEEEEAMPAARGAGERTTLTQESER